MDSKMDVDVPKETQPHGLSPSTDPGSIPTLDGWIENLMSCKQLAENDVQRLCDRVCIALMLPMETEADNSRRLEKYYKRSPMSSLWYASFDPAICP
jgi:hypothetical protein